MVVLADRHAAYADRPPHVARSNNGLSFFFGGPMSHVRAHGVWRLATLPSYSGYCTNQNIKLKALFEE